MINLRQRSSPNSEILWTPALRELLDQNPPISEASLALLGFDFSNPHAERYGRETLQFVSRLEEDPPGYDTPILRVACVDFSLLGAGSAPYLRIEGRIFKREANGFINEDDFDAASGEVVAFVVEYTIQSLASLTSLVGHLNGPRIALLDLDTRERSLAIQESMAIQEALPLGAADPHSPTKLRI